ncbi:MAG: hypothetical protein KF845_13010 [Cyclobacteriaceae bacterium]|nr:hypothetical protein [Cyclobacteriaceae bacterium]
MKPITTLFALLITLTTWGQKNIQATDNFVVTGEVKKELKFTLSDIEKHVSKNIGDVVITSHTGDPRGTARQLKGVLVKDILKNIELKEESPKLLSEFYFIFTAVDDYKVVYSWNEIFNSPTGDNLYVITTRDGKKLKDMEDRILILTPTDFKTGRRHIKGLSKIVVERVR